MAHIKDRSLAQLAMECMIISHDCCCHYEDHPKGCKRGKQEAIAKKIKAWHEAQGKVVYLNEK